MGNEDIELGKKVASLRAAADISQGQLAEALGVAQQTIAKIEKGNRPLKFTEAASICSFVGVPVSTLLESPREFDLSAAFLGQIMHVEEDIRGRFDELADELASRLFLLSGWLRSIRKESPRPDGWAELEQRAIRLLQKDWGHDLNDYLTREVSIHLLQAGGFVNEEEITGRSYAEMLMPTDRDHDSDT